MCENVQLRSCLSIFDMEPPCVCSPSKNLQVHISFGIICIPFNMHCVNALYSRICSLNKYLRTIHWGGGGVLCVPGAHRQSAQALVLKELVKLLKGKRKENVKKGPFAHTQSARICKFNKDAPVLIVNNFPALEALCPC